MLGMQPDPSQTTRAHFNPLIRPYMVLNIGLALMVSIIGIPLAIIWFLGVGPWWARHYFDKLECEIGPTALRFRKGILFQVERTIPLENIQDVTFIEGPLLRRFNLSTLKFETAGQSAGQAHDMQLTGIVDAHELRRQILTRREALRHRESLPSGGTSPAQAETVELLRAISARLDEVVGLMRQRG
jgi:membrane protein YdbS with pleckstrin-like domain